jgi:hypothetical protein
MVTRRSRPYIEDAIPARMTLMELLHSHQRVPAIPDGRAIKQVEALVSGWNLFYADRETSRQEREISFPAMARFVDKICGLVYSTNNLSLASGLIVSLNSLASHEPEYVFDQLVRLSKNHKDERISSMALSCLESNFGLMISTPERSSFYIMWEVLALYENEPTHLMRVSAQEFAKTASSFIFAHKEYLLENGYRNLLPYGIAWGTGISIKDRIRFMEDIADGTDDSLKTNLFSRVVLLSGAFPAGFSKRFEAPVPARIAGKFPEIARIVENRRQLYDAVESSEIKRLQEAASSLLAYSGKQIMPSGTGSFYLQ